MNLFRSALVVVPAALILASCAAKQPSTIVVGLTSEAPMPATVDTVRITVDRGGTRRLDTTYDVSPGGTKVPGTLVIANTDDSDSTSPVTVTVRAFSQGVMRAERRSTLGFVEGKQKLLRMPIQFACFDTDCPSGQTCHAGECVAEGADTEKLPDFAEEKVVPVAGKCFPREDCEKASMAMTLEQIQSKIAADPTFFNPKDCSIAIAEARPDLNMGIVWADEPTGNWTVIDFDPEEGWAFTDDTHTRVRLSRGMCLELAKPHPRIRKVVAKAGCAPKPATMPECP